MELIFKLPKNKLPFLGIVFENMGEAVRLNADLVDTRKEAGYKLQLMPTRSGDIDLNLYSFEPFIRREYNHLKCDLKKMEIWLEQTKYNNAFHFSHLIKEFDREMVVKTLPNRNLWVLRLQKVDLLWM